MRSARCTAGTRSARPASCSRTLASGAAEHPGVEQARDETGHEGVAGADGVDHLDAGRGNDCCSPVRQRCTTAPAPPRVTTMTAGPSSPHPRRTASSDSPGQSHSTSSSLSLTTSARRWSPRRGGGPAPSAISDGRARWGRRTPWRRARVPPPGGRAPGCRRARGRPRDAAGVDVAVCRQARDRGHLPLEVEHVGRGARGIDRRVGDGREGGALGAGGECHTALTAYALDAPTPLVGRDPLARSTGCSSAASPKATLAGLPPTCSSVWPAGVVTASTRASPMTRVRTAGWARSRRAPQASIMSVLPNHPGRSKRCSLSMVRMVPLRERMTRELVRADFAP